MKSDTEHRTLAEFIKARRADKKLSMRDLAKLAGINQTVIYKLEAGGTQPRGRVRAESLDAALRGLGIREGTDDYAHAYALWASEQHGRSARAKPLPTKRVAAGFASNEAKTDAERERIRKACDEAIDHIPRDLWPDMLTALRQHRALKLWIESASALTKRR